MVNRIMAFAKLRTLTPNVITAASFVAALGSVFCSQAGLLEAAGWLIVWCVLLDLADGVVARVLKAESRFGAEFDSLADVAAFGIAPAFLVLHVYWQPGGPAASPWVVVPCACYALAAALRLARFNAEPGPAPGWFRGVPTTMAGALVATGVILLQRYPVLLEPALGLLVLPACLLVLAYLMISGLAFPKPRPGASRTIRIFLFANAVAIYACGALRLWPEYLFAVAVTYLAAGLVAGARTTLR